MVDRGMTGAPTESVSARVGRNARAGERARKTERILALRASGLTHREIAARVGVAESTVNNYICDADGTKDAERRKRYAGVCERCGAATSGHDGIGKASRICAACYAETMPRAQHGTRSKYNTGCRCDECRRALREHMRSLQGKPAPSHGLSGYDNYGCRCDVCREAKRAKNARRYRAGHGSSSGASEVSGG